MATQIIGKVTTAFTAYASQIYYVEQNLLPMQVYMHDFHRIIEKLDNHPDFEDKKEYRRRLIDLRDRYRSLIDFDTTVTVRTGPKTYHAFIIDGIYLKNGEFKKGTAEGIPDSDILAFSIQIYDESLEGKYNFAFMDTSDKSRDKMKTISKASVFRGNYKPLSPLKDLPIIPMSRMNNSRSYTSNITSLLQKWNNIEYVYIAMKSILEELRTLIVLELTCEHDNVPVFKQYNAPD